MTSSLNHLIFLISLSVLPACSSIQDLWGRLNELTASPKEKKLDQNLEKANQYARDGLFREAIAAYQRALNTSPKNPDIQRNLGILYVKVGDYAKAVRHLEKSLRKFRNDFEANYYLAEAYRAQMRFGQAIFRYNRALEQKPRHVKSLKALTWSYYKVRFYSEALRSAKKLLRFEPNDHQSIIINSRTLLKLGRYSKALAMLRRGQALAKKGEMPYLLSVEGEVYLKTGQVEKAEKVFRLALKDQPLLPGALLGLAKTLIRSKKNFPLAMDYMERAVRIKPGLTEALYLLGKYYGKKDPKKSLYYFQNFQKLAATDPEFQEELLEVRRLRSRQASKPTSSQPSDN